MQGQVLITIGASAPRRVFGVVTLVLLGGLLIWLALAHPPAGLVWQAFLVLAGLLALWGGERMRRATAGRLILTDEGLHAGDGSVIAPVGRIRSLDRGMFAFKPSNGFILRLDQAVPARWEPGMWWCLGRRIGVGGVTSRAQTKAMADALGALLAQR